MQIKVIEFTPIFAEEWQDKLDGGVETCLNSLQALRQFRALYPEGSIIDVEQLSEPFYMDIKEYEELNGWSI